MSDATETVTWLTREAFDRLQAELDHLSGPARVEISKKIEAARAEGDLRENGGYHAAKEEQGKQEARIRQLTSLLRQAKVGTAPAQEGVAGPGMVVTVRFEGSAEAETFLIGSREEAGLSDIEVYSAQSPLGKALLGARDGDTVEYTTPSGRAVQVAVVSVTPYVRGAG